MKWYYRTQGIHTHVRVFVNGALAGNLAFRAAEFLEIREAKDKWPGIEFIRDMAQPELTAG